MGNTLIFAQKATKQITMKEVTLSHLYELFSVSSGVCTDSRKPRPGSIFFALRGENFDGNKFALDAIQEGCSYAVVNDPSLPKHPQLLFTAGDTLQLLADLAHYHRQQLSIPIIAITGTNGKTTTKELIGAVLSTQYQTLITEGNLNNHIGVPLTLLRLQKEHQLAVVEMGASHPGDIEHLVRIAAPNYGIITNIGKAHLQGFGSIEGVRRTKGELYDYLRTSNGTVFLHIDNDYLREMVGEIPCVTYGKTNWAQITGWAHTTSCGLLTVKWISAQDREKEYTCQTHLVGDYNLPNVLAAITVGNFFDIPPQVICQAIESYIPGNQRSQLVPKTLRNNCLVVDGYNANPASMEVAIDNLLRMPMNEYKQRSLILGDMNELGEESEKEHKALIERLLPHIRAKELTLYLCGHNFYQTRHLYEQEENINFFPTTEALHQFLQEHPLSNNLILLKGSNSLRITSLTELC